MCWMLCEMATPPAARAPRRACALLRIFTWAMAVRGLHALHAARHVLRDARRRARPSLPSDSSTAFLCLFVAFVNLAILTHGLSPRRPCWCAFRARPAGAGAQCRTVLAVSSALGPLYIAWYSRMAATSGCASPGAAFWMRSDSSSSASAPASSPWPRLHLAHGDPHRRRPLVDACRLAGLSVSGRRCPAERATTWSEPVPTRSRRCTGATPCV